MFEKYRTVSLLQKNYYIAWSLVEEIRHKLATNQPNRMTYVLYLYHERSMCFFNSLNNKACACDHMYALRTHITY